MLIGATFFVISGLVEYRKHKAEVKTIVFASCKEIKMPNVSVPYLICLLSGFYDQITRCL